MTRSERFTNWLEGQAVNIIKDGLSRLNSLERLNISDEFFMELRQRSANTTGFQAVRLHALRLSIRHRSAEQATCPRCSNEQWTVALKNPRLR